MTSAERSNAPRRLAQVLLLVLCAPLACVLGGCGTSTLSGIVVDGGTTRVEIVDAHSTAWADAQQMPGIPGASVTLHVDPQRPSRSVADSTTTRGDGTFSLRMAEPGAGVLIYDVALICRSPGRAPAESYFRFPAGGQRVIVTLAPGRDRAVGPGESIETQIDRYLR